MFKDDLYLVALWLFLLSQSIKNALENWCKGGGSFCNWLLLSIQEFKFSPNFSNILNYYILSVFSTCDVGTLFFFFLPAYNCHHGYITETWLKDKFEILKKPNHFLSSSKQAPSNLACGLNESAAVSVSMRPSSTALIVPKNIHKNA